EFSPTALHSHGNRSCFEPITVHRTSELRRIYILPLETADFSNAHPGECCHQRDFFFRISRNLQDALQLIGREHMRWFANHARERDRLRGILSKEEVGPGRMREHSSNDIAYVSCSLN